MYAFIYIDCLFYIGAFFANTLRFRKHKPDTVLRHVILTSDANRNITGTAKRW